MRFFIHKPSLGMPTQLSRFGGAGPSGAVVGACGRGWSQDGRPVPTAELAACSRMVKPAAGPLTWRRTQVQRERVAWACCSLGTETLYYTLQLPDFRFEEDTLFGPGMETSINFMPFCVIAVRWWYFCILWYWPALNWWYKGKEFWVSKTVCCWAREPLAPSLNFSIMYYVLHV